MNIAVLIPDRGDRPQLIENCLRMMRGQTLQPHITLVICDPPTSDVCDITRRYRQGYTFLSNRNDIDLIAFVENDDWYAPDYLETMAKLWEQQGRPDIFGTNYTIYYQLRLRKWFKFEHYDRASAMNTFIRPGLPINWCVDSEPYTDIHLWLNCGLAGKLVDPGRHISIGMKHGIGKPGGDFHMENQDVRDFALYFKNSDNGLLRNTLDPVSFEFYDNLLKS